MSFSFAGRGSFFFLNERGKYLFKDLFVFRLFFKKTLKKPINLLC